MGIESVRLCVDLLLQTCLVQTWTANVQRERKGWRGRIRHPATSYLSSTSPHYECTLWVLFGRPSVGARDQAVGSVSGHTLALLPLRSGGRTARFVVLPKSTTLVYYNYGPAVLSLSNTLLVGLM